MDQQTIETEHWISNGSFWKRQLSVPLLSYSASRPTVSSECITVGANDSETSAMTSIDTQSAQEKVNAVVKLIELYLRGAELAQKGSWAEEILKADHPVRWKLIWQLDEWELDLGHHNAGQKRPGYTNAAKFYVCSNWDECLEEMKKVFPDSDPKAKNPAIGLLYLGEEHWATVREVRMKVVMAAVERHPVPHHAGLPPIDAHEEDYFTIELLCGKGLE